jgi:3-oxo-5-alpha-steroid 4-dehydrogenase 3
MQDITVPHAFFSHFYLVGFLVTLTLIQHTLFPNHFAVGMGRPPAVLNAKGKLPFAEGTDHVFLLALMLIHVARRLYESTLIERHGPDSRLHIAGYIYGLW